MRVGVGEVVRAWVCVVARGRRELVWLGGCVCVWRCVLVVVSEGWDGGFGVGVEGAFNVGMEIQKVEDWDWRSLVSGEWSVMTVYRIRSRIWKGIQARRMERKPHIFVRIPLDRVDFISRFCSFRGAGTRLERNGRRIAFPASLQPEWGLGGAAMSCGDGVRRVSDWRPEGKEDTLGCHCGGFR